VLPRAANDACARCGGFEDGGANALNVLKTYLCCLFHEVIDVIGRLFVEKRTGVIERVLRL
jgi:hypothetical protein